jgi:hypothetical protein
MKLLLVNPVPVMPFHVMLSNVMPAKAGIHTASAWTPAFAGVTGVR